MILDVQVGQRIFNAPVWRVADEIDPLPTYPRLARVKWDWQRTSDGLPRRWSVDKDLPDSQGWPDTTKLLSDTFIDMTKPIQVFWMNLLSMEVFGIPDYRKLKRVNRDALEKSWLSLTLGKRALTNDHGTEKAGGRRNYIKGWNLTSKKFPGLETIDMGGNLLRVLGSPVGKYHPVAALDPEEPLKSIEGIWQDRTLIHVCTNSDGVPAMNGWKISRFPQLDKFGSLDVLWPFFAPGGVNWIKDEYIEFLPQGVQWVSPYNP